MVRAVNHVEKPLLGIGRQDEVRGRARQQRSLRDVHDSADDERAAVLEFGVVGYLEPSVFGMCTHVKLTRRFSRGGT
jgi:hypothetical protein